MTYTRLNPQQSTVTAGAVAESDFTVTGQRYVRYGPLVFFFLNATTANALSAGTAYSVATIPYTLAFGAANLTVGVGVLGTGGLLQARPTVAVAAGATLYFRGWFML